METINETVLKAQYELIRAQIKLIEKLVVERDEAQRNLKIASEQWEIWRQELINKE